MNDLILSEYAGGVARLTLNRPSVLNAFTLPMARELQAALDDIATRPDVRAVLLTGAGRAFCAGQDLSSVSFEPGVPLPDLGNVVRDQYNPIVQRMRALEKPIVCAVNGVAAGAGANIAFATDIVLASSEASFIQSFTKIGLVPDSGGSFWLPRLAGHARASALLLLGDKLGAVEAKDWGLIWQVYPPSELMPRAVALAESLAAQPTRALGLTKRLIDASYTNDLPAQLALEESLQREVGTTSDFKEGVLAFLEKRRPVFTGR
jgi:2-(1,2-epoxy-1,2-dihydrophenyl)acetyl-CoA isomerase